MSLHEPFSVIPYCPKDREPGEIGQLIRRAREDAGLSVDQLAQAANIGPLDVMLWETGPVSICSLQAILGVLGKYLAVWYNEVGLFNEFVQNEAVLYNHRKEKGDT